MLCQTVVADKFRFLHFLLYSQCVVAHALICGFCFESAGCKLNICRVTCCCCCCCCCSLRPCRLLSREQGEKNRRAKRAKRVVARLASLAVFFFRPFNSPLRSLSWSRLLLLSFSFLLLTILLLLLVVISEVVVQVVVKRNTYSYYSSTYRCQQLPPEHVMPVASKRFC